MLHNHSPPCIEPSTVPISGVEPAGSSTIQLPGSVATITNPTSTGINSNNSSNSSSSSSSDDGEYWSSDEFDDNFYINNDPSMNSDLGYASSRYSERLATSHNAASLQLADCNYSNGGEPANAQVSESSRIRPNSIVDELRNRIKDLAVMNPSILQRPEATSIPASTLPTTTPTARLPVTRHLLATTHTSSVETPIPVSPPTLPLTTQSPITYIPTAPTPTPLYPTAPKSTPLYPTAPTPTPLYPTAPTHTPLHPTAPTHTPLQLTAPTPIPLHPTAPTHTPLQLITNSSTLYPPLMTTSSKKPTQPTALNLINLSSRNANSNSQSQITHQLWNSFVRSPEEVPPPPWKPFVQPHRMKIPSTAMTGYTAVADPAGASVGRGVGRGVGPRKAYQAEARQPADHKPNNSSLGWLDRAMNKHFKSNSVLEVINNLVNFSLSYVCCLHFLFAVKICSVIYQSI